MFIEDIKSVFKKLPHSEGRVPYTYHHDFLRTNVYHEASRSDIAKLKICTEEELYTTALVFLIESLSLYNIVTMLDEKQIKTVKDAKKITELYIERVKILKQYTYRKEDANVKQT